MTRKIDFAQIPLGKPLEADTSSEDRHPSLEDWSTPLTPHRYWNRPSHFEVIDEAGQRVLAHPSKHDDCLIAGDGFDADYTVEAEMAQLGAETVPNNDDRFGTTSRAGAFARYRTLRHYYQFCIEGLERLRLYRRADEDWHVLAERKMEVEPGRYYTLAMQVQGDEIVCRMDGEEAFRVSDPEYATGKAGWRTNGDSRLRRIELSSGPAADSAANARRAAHQEDVTTERERYPQPVLWKVVPKGDLTGTVCQLGHATGLDTWTVLLHSSTAVYTPDDNLDALLALVDFEGTLVWQRDLPVRFPRLIDLDGDGRDEIVCFLDDHLTILDGAEGQVIAQTALPEAKRRDGSVGPLWPEFNGIAFADLCGIGRPSDIVLKEENHTGGHNLWAYDSELQSLWHAVVGWPRYGHGIDFWDVNGDGRDEVMAGYDLLSADGELIRRVEGAEGIPPLGSDHADVVAVGPFGPEGELLAGICTGSDGFWLVDILTGQPIARHRIGHAQGIAVGRFFPDLPGLQFLSGTRWDNYGIISFFSTEGERLFTFEPDNVAQGGPPVNWTGDGRELLLLASTPPILGMYDHRGRKVVEFPADFPEREFYGKIGGLPVVMDVTGDPRDEVIFNTPNAVYIYTQSAEPAPPDPIYAPRRPTRGNILPSKSIPEWESL